MAFVIERHGWFHSAGGWKTTEAGATQFETEQEANDVLDDLKATTLIGLPGEVRVREARK